MYSDVVFIFFLQVGFRKYTIYFSSDKNFSLKNLLKASPLSPSLFPSTPPVHVPPPVTAAGLILMDIKMPHMDGLEATRLDRKSVV